MRRNRMRRPRAMGRRSPSHSGGRGSSSGLTMKLCRSDGWTRTGRRQAKARRIRDATAPVLSRKHDPPDTNRRNGAPQGDALPFAREARHNHLRLAALHAPHRREAGLKAQLAHDARAMTRVCLCANGTSPRACCLKIESDLRMVRDAACNIAARTGHPGFPGRAPHGEEAAISAFTRVFRRAMAPSRTMRPLHQGLILRDAILTDCSSG